MPFYLIHANTSLQKVSVTGNLVTISLPSGVTLVNTRPARFAVLENKIVVVNASSVNFYIDASDLTTRKLSLTAPATALTAVSGGAGALNGTYRYFYTYAIVDGSGDIIVESPASPISTAVNFVNNSASLSGVTAGESGVTHRIIYRTTSNGATYFEAGRITGNVTTTTTDNVSDYDLELLEAAEPKGNPPGVDGTNRFRLITSWKDRLFAAEANDPDIVWVSGNREISSWAETRSFSVKPIGEDEYGVTAFMARRDELVMAKRRKLWKLIGTSPADFEQILIADGVGAVNQDASIIVKDTCYFLGEDGFYEYGQGGVKRLSREKVQPWFTTDDYFNRSLFDSAFAKYNSLYDKIELHLAAAGSSNIDRWVEYDLKQKEWFGPHKTDAFTPTCGGAMDNADGMSTPVLGASNAFLYRQNQEEASDDGTAIDMDIITKFHAANTPDIEKYWGEMALLTKVEDGGILIVTPTVGGLDATASDPFEADLTLGRERLGRLGNGRLLQLRFQNAEKNRSVTIYAYEVPFHELGRR